MSDHQFQVALREILKNGSEVESRNSKTKRIRNLTMKFDKAPLISVRRTAWKNALFEFEWFMSGSNDINDLHEDVRSWWKPFCEVDNKTLPYNYGKSFRRIYNPFSGKDAEYEPKILELDEPVKVPVFEILDIIPSKDPKVKYIGYKGQNSQGDSFQVQSHIDGGDYFVQFGSNGYIVKSKAVNFKKGIVKNPYYPSVLGVGCFGKVNKKDFSYYDRAYKKWTDMMNRCYNEKRRHYKWYKSIKVSARWKCFEYFINDLSKLEGFEEWLLNPGKFHLDKDYKKANYYDVETCVFLHEAQNVGLANAERFYEVPRRQLHLDQVTELIDGIKNDPYSRRNVISTWIPEHVHSGLMNPTNCHGSLIQTFVEPDNSLHLTMYQRSADMCLGVPHNLIQYWAFLQYLAHHGNREVGSFTWIGGDCHIYEDHTDMAQKIITEDINWIKDIELVYNPTSKEFKADDFSLSGDYCPIIKESLKMTV